ncbi:MAG: NAD-dependent epimerase/dehydratase family protein [Planctomycetota bacterium]
MRCSFLPVRCPISSRGRRSSSTEVRRSTSKPAMQHADSFILLTGATGLLGRSLLRDLTAAGRRVAVVVRSSKTASAACGRAGFSKLNSTSARRRETTTNAARSSPRRRRPRPTSSTSAPFTARVLSWVIL